MAGKYTLITCLLLALGIAFISDVQVPEDFQEPYKLRLYFALLKLNNVKRYIEESLYGRESYLLAKRKHSITVSSESKPDDVEFEEHDFDGVDVRIYTPRTGPTSDSAVIYYHGGGWVLGGYNDVTHVPMVKMTRHLQNTIVSVSYRLAPEHPYPAPFEDCLRATKHFFEHASHYGVNTSRIALMGTSAGGNLAAAVALHLRDEGYKYQPRLQVLLYPPLQALDFFTPSYQKYQNDLLLPKHVMVCYWLWYAFGEISDFDAVMQNMHTTSAVKKDAWSRTLNHGEIPQELHPRDYRPPDLDSGNATLWQKMAERFTDPYLAPLMASDLRGLPRAYILTGEQDVLRDDSFWYAQRLRAAGNDVTHVHAKFVFHALLNLDGFKDQHLAWSRVGSFVKRELQISL